MNLLTRKLREKRFYIKEVLAYVTDILIMWNIIRVPCGLRKRMFLAKVAFDTAEAEK